MSSSPPAQIRRILVPIDGSKNADRAVDFALSLAKANSADVSFLYVVTGHGLIEAPLMDQPVTPGYLDDYYEFVGEKGKQLIKAANAEATSRGVKASGKIVVAPAHVVEAITDEASKKKADLIVMGTRGLGGFKKMVMGSVSTGVIHNAACAVMVIR